MKSKIMQPSHGAGNRYNGRKCDFEIALDDLVSSPSRIVSGKLRFKRPPHEAALTTRFAEVA
ncbi:hypothetical protein [Paracoccus sp. PAR01]|uniref:hypothetical protein n=1 Tax=Paracoccus sp. PAR01 TaxID=2769282 RepID=UPI00177CDDE6|nr:hypothetical protein [Paracoccus sp. PAR01]MBD9529491.1 hypothetical protein [Paracoccus sp. PAR01]